jgi:hypothetical protein
MLIVILSRPCVVTLVACLHHIHMMNQVALLYCFVLSFIPISHLTAYSPLLTNNKDFLTMALLLSPLSDCLW